MLRYEIPTGDKHRYTEEKEVLLKAVDPSFFLSSGAFYSNISSPDASHLVRDGILESSASGIT